MNNMPKIHLHQVYVPVYGFSARLLPVGLLEQTSPSALPVQTSGCFPLLAAANRAAVIIFFLKRIH